MPRVRRIVLPLTLTALVFATPAARALTPTVTPHPAVRRGLTVSFSAPALPEGGYYYAVVVLEPYRGFTATVPPACSTSSEMQRTAYGRPDSHGNVYLALAPARSDTGRWCAGGHYTGAVYSVPHEPPCEETYPCKAEPYEPSPCWGSEGHRVCGVVAKHDWRYPQPLPVPRAPGAAIVAHFTAAFPTHIRFRLHLAATIYDVNETLEGVVSSHEALKLAGRPVGQDFSSCTPDLPATTAHCTGKYHLRGGTIAFSGTVATEGRTRTLTITGGTGRYRGAEGSVVTEYLSRSHARETITLEG